MVFRRILRPAAAGAILFFGLAAAPMQRDAAALGRIEHGKWQLKQPDGTARTQCMAAASAWVQIRHPGLQCQQVVISGQGDKVTMGYNCPGHGNGQTTISVETPRLVRVETSGVVDGAPFQDEYEARKIGPCG